MDWILAIWAVATLAAAFFASLVGTGAVLRALRARAILDHPNERSSHSTPTPRGGGVAVTGVLVLALFAIALATNAPKGEAAAVLGGALTLAAVSWLDDLRGLSALSRLAAHAAAVTVVLVAAPAGAPPFGGVLPPPFETVAAGILWVWFINLFNFMDGIDGISGVETASIGVGAALVGIVGGLGAAPVLFGLAAAGAALGFLKWNWAPAKIFLGDVGSVPIGFLLGWLLLNLSGAGQPEAALILPLYYLADATITLGRRALRGEKIWRAHREHFYQIAVQAGASHGRVGAMVLVANAALVGLAVTAAMGMSPPALGGACVVVAVLLILLGAGKTSAPESGPS